MDLRRGQIRLASARCLGDDGLMGMRDGHCPSLGDVLVFAEQNEDLGAISAGFTQDDGEDGLSFRPRC